MKRINELEEREILALTNEDIEKMIKFSWAENGVKIIDKPKAPELPDIPKEDVRAYAINGLNYLFLDYQDAERVSVSLREAKSIRDYSYDISYHKIVRNITADFVICETAAYSPELIKEVTPLIKKRKELQEAYDAETKEYESEKEKQDELSSRIWNRINDVRDEYAHMEHLWNIYKDEYLELAEDEAIAMAFLKKAYTVNSKAEFYIEDKLKELKAAKS
jgi:hypothetical protein